MAFGGSASGACQNFHQGRLRFGLGISVDLSCEAGSGRGQRLQRVGFGQSGGAGVRRSGNTTSGQTHRARRSDGCGTSRSGLSAASFRTCPDDHAHELKEEDEGDHGRPARPQRPAGL